MTPARAAACWAAVFLLVGAAAPERPAPVAEVRLGSAQSDYVEHCGGCHGIQGTSFPARVPPLRDRIGYFLCTPETRAYLLQLPNVALSSTDDEQLAEIMNFVVFGLGGRSTRPGAAPFTAAEVAAQRRHPLSSASLIGIRTKLTREIVARCKVPVSALRF